jgi:phenylalanyl-tRNA synthetase beta chain
VSAAALKLFDIKSTVYYAELDITDYLGREPVTPTYAQLPRFPALERDFCFVMAEDIESQKISEEIANISNLVEDVYPFDVYRGEKLGAGLKSVAYSVRLRSKDKTLSEAEAAVLSDKIVAAMQSKYSAELRT